MVIGNWSLVIETMSLPANIVLIVNTVLLLIAFVIVGFLAHAGSRHDWNYGISKFQDPLKVRIMRLIIALITVGFAAAAFNLINGLL